MELERPGDSVRFFRRWQRRVWLVMLLAGLGWPTSTLATEPTVSNNAFTVKVGGSVIFYLSDSTTWTGDVTTLSYYIGDERTSETINTPYASVYVQTMGGWCGYWLNNGQYAGTDSFTWFAVDVNGETSAVATCTITISNDVPRAASATWSVVGANPPNPLADLAALVTHADNNQTMTYVVTTAPTNGTASIVYTNASYWLFYTPNGGFTQGIDSLDWTVSDGIATSAPAQLTMIFGTNNVPAANPIFCTATSGVRATPLFNPSGNYTHPDIGQTISYLIATPATFGTARMDPTSGYIDYIPAPLFAGTDTLMWAVSDGVSTSTPALVTITVLPSQPVPANQTVVVAKNTPLTFTPGLSGGGGYADSLVRVGNPAHGTVVVTNGAQFCYKPTTNYLGTDSFTWKIVYSNAVPPAHTSATVTCSIVVKDASTNADWTQWRFDECRTAQTPMPLPLPDKLFLQWRRDLPTCAGAFDSLGAWYPKDMYIDVCRPVQLGKSLFVSCLANDSVSAYDTDTGAQKWRYYAGGALRRPPAVVALTNGTNVVVFGCDDGIVYCLNAADGSEYWKFQAAPNTKKAMGFKRLSSVWPIWASPVVCSNKVYFASGYVPTWGVFVYCLDVTSGAVVWCNDGRLCRNGSYNQQNSSLGPLALSTDHSKIFGTTEGKSSGWIISLSNGEVAGFGTGGTGHDGDNLFWYVDGSGNNKQNEPMSLVAGGQTITNADVLALGVAGTLGSVLAGDGKLFVTTLEGSIYCFGGSNITPTIYANTVTPLPATNDVWTMVVQSMLTNRADLAQGLALVWGVGSGRLVEELAKQAPGLMIVAADPDTNKLMRLRREMDAAGWSGARVSTLQGNPMDCGFAPYQAALIMSEDVNACGFSNGAAMVQMLYKCTRPFGGEIWLATSNAQHATIAGWLAAATNMVLHDAVASVDVQQRTGFAGLGSDGFTQIRRLGLPDANVALKPPFRLTAFGVSGEAIVQMTYADPSPYTLDPRPIYDMRNYWIGWGPGVNPQRGVKSGRDIYSWLPISTAMTGYEPTAPAYNNTNASSTLSPALASALYARVEDKPLVFGSGSGSCSGVDQYGFTLLQPGKIGYLTDVANYRGVLIFPDMGGCGGASFAGNGVAVFGASKECNCNHGFAYSQIGFVTSDDPNDEQWVSYQLSQSSKNIQELPVRKVGINFGAPGDRYVEEDQLLWTHHPTFGRGTVKGSVDAPPLIPVRYRGNNVMSVYHHSVQMAQTTNRYRGWVASSCVSGMNGMTIPLASPLVAYRTATPPTLDGKLDDSCWTNQIGVEMPMNVQDFNNSMWTNDTSSAAYVKLCYDDTNLYIAAGVRASQVPSVCCVQIALNSREQRVSPVMLWDAPPGAHGKLSLGISTNVWQVAATTNNQPSAVQTVYQEEMVIPWSALAAAGLWKEQLVMNVAIGRSVLNGTSMSLNGWGSDTHSLNNSYALAMADYLSPMYLDQPRGAVTNVTPHTVRLYFAEMEGLTNGQRTFDVQLQGQTVLTNLDVVAQAGGPKRELMKEFQNVAIADHLDIAFPNACNAPMLSGVEIIDTQTNATGAHLDPPNLPPVAVITASMTNGPAPLDVTLSAQRSYDPDGQIVECAWETGDGRLARGSQLHHIFAEPGTYTVNLLVLDNRGGTGTTNMTVTVTAGVPAAFVCNIRSNGLPGRDYSTLSAWNAAIKSDLTSTQSLLFSVSSLGSYVTNDDGKAVTFTGGGTGTLKHISSGNIAYVTGCSGTIQTGTVTNKTTGHTFTIADTGNPIVTAVAQGYNDWPKSGLSDAATITGWTADQNHCVSIRPAPGQGHTGNLKNASTNYTGFTLKGNLNAGAAAYTRIDKIAVDAGNVTIGATGSVNRVLDIGAVAQNTYLSGATIANSIFTTFNHGSGSDVSLYNCTAQTFNLLDFPQFGYRAVNCLAWVTNSTGFNLQVCSGTANMSWMSRCVSVDSTATRYDTWQDGNEGNQTNKTVTFVSAASNDFHLAATDTGARAMGVPGLGADINGNVRTGPYYDVGADQTYFNHAPQLQNGPFATPNPVATGAVVQFTFSAVDIDGNVLTNFWVFGDGSSGLPQLAFVTNHIYNAIGTYTAQVAISDGSLAVTGTVVVSVVGSAPAVSAFDCWRVAYFGATNAPGAGPMDDPYHCGMNNQLKYLMGMDPLNPDAVFKILSINAQATSNGVWWYGGTTNTGFIDLFAVEGCTNLGGTQWIAKGSNLFTSLTGTNLWWDTNLPPNAPTFYRVTTQLSTP